MHDEFDLVIRGGTVVDGTGKPGYVADVAIAGDRIVEIGQVQGSGRREIEASGKLVTPGFIDIHTHYDGQAIWSDRLAPSSQHGVTTAIIGNCGVGFAPCRPEDHDLLVSVMEGVEDIPEIVMTKGLSWDWETFPQYLDALSRRKRDIDIAAYLPHSPLRIYAMGDRGAALESANDNDLARIRALVEEALDAGAIGFATSRSNLHRTGEGSNIPSFETGVPELSTILGVMKEKGKGIFQLVLDSGGDTHPRELQMLMDLTKDIGCPTTFTMLQMNDQPEMWQLALKMMEETNKTRGTRITAQVFPRPVGMIMGLETSVHPFTLCPSYEELRDLPLDERIRRMKDPAVRERIINENPRDPTNPVAGMSRNFERIFQLRNAGDYEPKPSDSMAARARAAGVTPQAIAYDCLLENDGRAVLLNALANFSDGNFDAISTMIKHDDTILGLGDGGAHYGLVSDSSYPTFVLTHWTRDRDGEKISVPSAIKALSSEPASVVGLNDRGVVAPGYKADLNVIDYERLTLHIPHVIYDLPAGGGRLVQNADGYVATIVSGQIIAQNDLPTGTLPGRLVRSGGKH